MRRTRLGDVTTVTNTTAGENGSSARAHAKTAAPIAAALFRFMLYSVVIRDRAMTRAVLVVKCAMVSETWPRL